MRQTNKVHLVHLLSYTTMNKNHILYYTGQEYSSLQRYRANCTNKNSIPRSKGTARSAQMARVYSSLHYKKHHAKCTNKCIPRSTKTHSAKYTTNKSITSFLKYHPKCTNDKSLQSTQKTRVFLVLKSPREVHKQQEYSSFKMYRGTCTNN